MEISKLPGWKIALHSVAGIVILLLADLASSLFFDVLFTYVLTYQFPQWIYTALRSAGDILAMYGFLLLYVRKALHMTLSDFRISRFRIKPLYILCAFILPVFVVLCLMATGGELTINDYSSGEILSRVVIAVFGAGLKAAITEEMIFRGYIMKLLESKWNKALAALLPSFVFGALHILNLSEFNFVSLILLLCAGTGVGIMFSLITYANQSIWASTLVHAVWNIIMIGGILDISPKQSSDAITSFVLSSKNVLVTGGDFGVEASLFAVIGYIGVILLTAYSLNKRKARTAAVLQESADKET